MSTISRILPVCAVAVFLLLPSSAWSQCSDCHDDWYKSLQQSKIIHPALEDDGCGDCHEDHGDDKGLMLVEEGNELCFLCHDDPGTGASVHEAVSEGECIECHDPHASRNRALLLESTPGLCLQCHEVPEDPDSKAHAALTEGDCTDCHRPHASEKPGLLVGNYETKRFPKTFVEDMYSLCFQCHDADLVTGPAENTGFRNGLKNLHNLHVMGELKPNKYGIVRRGKAMSCSICHQPHGSDQDFNLLKEFKHNGIVFFTLDYTPTEAGGSCVVGCHKKRTYSRSVP